eukprot:00481.XXX_659_1397_1 [CDS] Oithona nana genome sequencing.
MCIVGDMANMDMARSTVMEVHKVNIAIVITANASTDMEPPDMVIVTKNQPKTILLVEME